MGVDLMPFADNWAYLKTELSWLDRLLMLSVARQRKDVKEVKKVANTKADLVSSHWWKGVISVSKPAYDDCRVPPPQPAKRKSIGYQKQLESRVQISAKDEIVLALPSLRHYLNLTLFEKNLVLLALAPEVNRRYGRLYHFLQTGEDCAKVSDLPTLDLALRLLCRNDLERRRARAKLSGPESLVERKILRYVSPRPSTRLNSYLQLNEDWVDYLLAEQPDQHVLFKQLATPQEPVLALPAPTAATRAVKITQPEVPWDKLIVPTSVLSQLQTLSQQTSAGLLTRYATLPSTSTTYAAPYANVLSGAEQPENVTLEPSQKGQLALLVGAAGTGKSMAAGAIATSLRQPLCVLDLNQIYPEHYKEILDSLDSTRYPVLLIKSASVWFGRNSTLPKAKLTQWLQARQAAAGITLLSTRYLHTVKATWRQHLSITLTLPLPHKRSRTILWRQAFAGIVCSDKIDWATLAKQHKMSGGDIQGVAWDALAIAQSKNAQTITLSHIQQALSQYEPAR